MTRGDQRDRDRARAEKRNDGKQGNNKHIAKSNYVQTKEQHAEIMRAKQAKADTEKHK